MSAGLSAGLSAGMMPSALLLVCLTGAASAQTPDWRRALMNLPEHPSPNTSLQDIQRLQQNLQYGAGYFATLTPGDYDANRELIRRLTRYVAGLELIAQDPRMRAAVGRLRRTMNEFPILIAPAQLQQQPDSSSVAPDEAKPAPGVPPFALQAPVIENVPADQKQTAEELSARYDAAAGPAAAAWQNAEVLSQNLAARGMALNATLSSAVARLQLYFEGAAQSLRERDWADARTNLERAEYETNKILKVVGR
jgi:hypothetical protein